MPEIIIRHPKTGHEVGIQSADYRRGKHHLNADGEFETYADAGYEIVSQMDGSPYEAPAERRASPASGGSAGSSAESKS